MKIKTFLIMAIVIWSSCQQSKNPHATHDAKDQENAMMKAMDESMVGMHQVKQAGNADIDFSAMMIPHHQGAIAMADALLKTSKTDSLEGFARQVIKAQQEEIRQLKAFLDTAKNTPTLNVKTFEKALNASMEPMMNGMQKIKPTGNLQKDFVALMIPHHQSAVEMAKAYLPYAKNAKIKKMATKIIEAQEKEITWLKGQ
jgi:uncharacterized protein (DUF305 family)